MVLQPFFEGEHVVDGSFGRITPDSLHGGCATMLRERETGTWRSAGTGRVAVADSWSGIAWISQYAHPLDAVEQ
ncbi:UNVERIFIED_ORG: hypothetical protein FHU01_4466 [Citrobacter freundii]